MGVSVQSEAPPLTSSALISQYCYFRGPGQRTKPSATACDFVSTLTRVPHKEGMVAPSPAHFKESPSPLIFKATPSGWEQPPPTFSWHTSPELPTHAPSSGVPAPSADCKAPVWPHV